jgi:hypothetical protein
MKIHFGYLLGFSALAIAGCAAFFSVYGISQLFIGASTAVIIMGGALELGKLVVASYLQREWKKMNKLMGGYMMVIVIVLMLITSGGIYGFLSSAYQQTNQKLTVNQNEIKFLKQKETFFADDVARYDTELARISENISTLSNTKANTIQVRDTSSSTGFRNTISTSGLRLAQDRIDVEEKNRKDVAIKRNVASDSLQKYQLAILDKQNNSEVSAELGPLIYISNLTGVEMDKVVNWFILLLIFVFDPLAVILVVATTKIFQREAKIIKKEKGLIEPEEPIKEKAITKESMKKPVKKENFLKKLFLPKKLTSKEQWREDYKQEELVNIDMDDPEIRIIEKSPDQPTQEEVAPDQPTQEEVAPDQPTQEEVAPDTNVGLTKVTPIKEGNPHERIKRADIKEIKEQIANRNFSKRIPRRRGY